MYLIQLQGISLSNFEMKDFIRSEGTKNKKNIILFVCGSFDPPTFMHLRIFEIARSHFHKSEQFDVIGGIISPINAQNNHQNVRLSSNEHRIEMIRLSLLTSDWIRLSDWQTKQTDITSMVDVLQYHQNYLDSILSDVNYNKSENIPNWLPRNIGEYFGQHVQIRLLQGADLLASFVGTNELSWTEQEIIEILANYGLVVIARSNIDLQSDLLSKLKRNITIIENLERNDLNSSLVRVLIQRNLSIKYLLYDSVTNYIYKYKLYVSNAETPNV